MSHKQAKAPITTTVGELTLAYYEAAMAELKDEALARRVAESLVRERLMRSEKR